MNLLETVKQLSEKRPLDRASIEALLGVALRGDPDNTNRHLEILRSFRHPPPIRKVEVRLPLASASRKNALVIVELLDVKLAQGAGRASIHADDSSQEQPISGDAVQAEFGSFDEVLEPEPEQPKDALHYGIYTKPWGALRFGFARPEWEALTTIVIDVER